MHELKCHSSTPYNEIINFIYENKGKIIFFHYEEKGYASWGYDEVKEIELNDEGINWIKDYLGTEYEYRNKNSAYVHSIKVKN